MKRQSRTPWVHRYWRPLMAGIATVGAAVTAYLTAIKLTQGSAICPTSGCDIVLSSPYATVFGLPLALFGFIAYASMALFAISPLLVPQSNQQLRSQLQSWTGLLLFAGGTAMTVFSGYLMYLLAFKIQAVCIYCVGSAILSTSLLSLAIVGRNWQDIGQLLFTGFIVATLVLVGTLAIYANANNPALSNSNTSTEQLSRQEYAITTTSGQAEIALAQHLKQIGAVFYGASWCPHCHDQKQLFGKEAAQEIPYVECDPKGINSQTERCQAAGVRGFPTWVINDRTVMGTQSLSALAKLSGYRGGHNFQSFQPTGK
ncbi:vitamin K epoxide reductase family protein [Scytonema millei]|uniref:Vitamin K epoxide reductase family protein n=1 Tax=Scytonema millei VB511283 TaxID=1245923 RepID=A0A9X5I5Q9_9CYAN|nr:vitamin K epoxide reductase family protein [Scytonema millei]NHC35969.1 vitamin K epoxide reductase family protein [Scytonema millei VB511283]